MDNRDDIPNWVQHRMFGINIDAVRMNQAVTKVWRWVRSGGRYCQFVVTPNVDHIVQLKDNLSLAQSYQNAGMVLADGWPLVASSHLFGKKLPERVAGSDLVPALFESASPERPLSVFLLGAAPGVGLTAAENIHEKWPSVKVLDTYSPPMGFEKNPYENEFILDRIAQCNPDVLVIGLGAPKQEIWISKHHKKISAKVALCVGATIDFLANNKKRAPRWMQACGVEWLHRVCSEPKRLFTRYAKDAVVFPRLVLKELASGSSRNSSGNTKMAKSVGSE